LTEKRLRGKRDRDLRLLAGGKESGVHVKRGSVGETGLHGRRQFVPAKELAEIFADAPAIDYKQFRADLDAVAAPSPWAGMTGRRGLIDTSVAIGLSKAELARFSAELAVSALTIAELAGGPHAASHDLERERREHRLRQRSTR
jgi:hypothetical protein